MGDEEARTIIRTLLEDVLHKDIRPVLESLRQAELDNRRVFRIMAEMVSGLELMQKIPDAVTIFGSSRSKPRDDIYGIARKIGRRFAEEGYAVITGGGPGLMEAVNRGAMDAGGVSVGLNIILPREQKPNKYITNLLNFRYFFIRKVMFVKYAKALICMPGGFGTMDELFESLTLKQTGKMQMFPIILYDGSYWGGLYDWLRTQMVTRGYLEEDELDLMTICNDPEEAVKQVAQFCRAQEKPYVTYLEPEEFTERL
ncbi:MAG: TIGR00730 family Rossman fold protein [bacterium]|nr:MAG: TIGR00730 family Rossman fold protein [bacterium]